MCSTPKRNIRLLGSGASHILQCNLRLPKKFFTISVPNCAYNANDLSMCMQQLTQRCVCLSAETLLVFFLFPHIQSEYVINQSITAVRRCSGNVESFIFMEVEKNCCKCYFCIWAKCDMVQLNRHGHYFKILFIERIVLSIEQLR